MQRGSTHYRGVGVDVHAGTGAVFAGDGWRKVARSSSVGGAHVEVDVFGLLLFVHVLGATVWTGGHLILAVTILPRAFQERSTDEIRRFEEGFEWIGIPALAGQVVTGLWLAYRLVPDPLEWLSFGSPVTRLIGFKLVLMAITVALAADARLRVIPRLTEERLTSLAWHIVPVTVISVLYVVVGLSFRTGWLP